MNKNIVLTTLFFGAIWGILEATLGYLLKFLPPLVSGSIMFPIGASLLTMVYLNTQSKTSVLAVGILAATIKSINFLMPGLLPIKTYNPMISIILQSMMMVGVCYLLDQKKVSLHLIGFAVASVMWRVLFYVNISINHALTNFPFPQMSSSQKTLEFIVTYGLMGALLTILCYGFIVLIKNRIVFAYRPKLYLSLSMIILAVALTFYLQLIG